MSRVKLALCQILVGTNKQANAAHGADSPEAARREISLIFGAELVEPQELARL